MLVLQGTRDYRLLIINIHDIFFLFQQLAFSQDGRVNPLM
jgi:hypothetical protein